MLCTLEIDGGGSVASTPPHTTSEALTWTSCICPYPIDRRFQIHEDDVAVAILLSPVWDAEGLVDGVSFYIGDFLVLAKAKASAGPPACGFLTNATPRFPLTGHEPSIQIVFESRSPHPPATYLASALLWTIIRPGKESLPLHCCRSTVYPDTSAAAARSRAATVDRSLVKASGPSPPCGLSYSRWVYLACLWFRKALAVMPRPSDTW